MMKLARKIGKLKQRSPAELRERGIQALSSIAERHGLSSQVRLPSDNEFFRLIDAAARDSLSRDLASHVKTELPGRLFPGIQDISATRTGLRTRFAKSYSQSVLPKAEKILSGRFDLLGRQDLFFGDPIDWRLEPVSGVRSGNSHWSRIDYLDPRVAGDKKFTWELNRHQYFTLLARAYVYTGDERFARCFTNHLESWIASNPPKRGINWASSLEIAFRSISWIWSFALFRDSPSLTSDLIKQALKVLYINGCHLETYLSTYFSPNTHLTGEALGLVYIGTAFPEFTQAARWREQGTSILLEQLSRQVLDDGVYFERATYYHRYTCDFYLHLLLLMGDGADAEKAKIRTALLRLVDHLMYITRPDGTSPFIGDDDGGRLAMLDESHCDDFRSTLCTGSIALERGDYKHVAGEFREESLWLMGPAGAERFEGLKPFEPQSTSKAFPSGGYYVMRSGWTADADYALIDCGPLGTLNCGHAHADALSIDLAVKGQSLLKDPGTRTYTGSSNTRNWFRSTLAHSTLVVDGLSSSEPGPDAFSWSSVAECTAEKWITSDRFDFFCGGHDGYSRLAQPASHQRTVLFIKGDYWIIRDLAESSSVHDYGVRFHFAPGIRPAVSGSRETCEVYFEPDADPVRLIAMNGQWRLVGAQSSSCYGSDTESQIAELYKKESRAEFLTLIAPSNNSGDVLVRHEAGAMVVQSALYRDLFACGANGVRLEELESDATDIWARFDATGLNEVIAIDCSSISLMGETLFCGNSRRDWVRATRRTNGFRLEEGSGG